MAASLPQDMHFALRQLAKRPGFTFTAIAILALGLGANTAIFSVVNAFLLKPLPYKDPSRLMGIFERDPVGPEGSDPFNYVAAGNFLDWQKMSASFEQMAAGGGGAFNLSSPSDAFAPERVDACICSATTFATLGVNPMLGRGFLPEEDKYGARKVAVISYGLWQQRFGGAPDILHRQIRLDGVNHEIVGVMPRGFAFPYQATDVWVPLLANTTPEMAESHDSHFLLVVGRLRQGVSVEQARAEIDGFAWRYKRAHPQEFSGKGGNVVPLHDYLVRDLRGSLLALLGAVGCVLLIACVNVANLLLARAAGRAREVAIREAVGASRGRIFRQLLTESVLLSLLGGGAGVLVAAFITSALVARAPGADSILLNGPVHDDPVVFLFTFGLAMLAGVAAGLFPALQSSRSDLVNSLKDGNRSMTPGRSHNRFRSILVAAEVALSLVLLVSAGLLLRSFSKLYGVKTGVRIDNTLTLGISLPDPDDTQHEKISAFVRRLTDRMQAVPGVIDAGIVSCPPVSGHCSDWIIRIDEIPTPPGQDFDPLARAAGPNYFRAAGIPLVAGRTFTGQDGVGFDKKHPKIGAVIISESMAKQFFHGVDPLGKHIHFGYDEERKDQAVNPIPHYEVIGVVGDVLQRLDAEVQPTFYTPALDGNFDRLHVVLHTTVEPHSLAAAVREEVHKLDPNLPLFDIRTMDEIIGQGASDRRFNLVLFGSFAGLAMLLAAVGLYGVLSYAVSQRRAEIGIRLALGATSTQVLGHVLRQGLTPAVAGVAVGLAGALLVGQVLKGLLFGIEPTDVVTLVCVPLLLLLVSFAACYLPAHRATQVDPTEALRIE
jgi:putative ABC transport system permease protein